MEKDGKKRCLYWSQVEKTLAGKASRDFSQIGISVIKIMSFITLKNL